MATPASNEALVDLLASRPLLGYQIDATHLHSVLRAILQQQQQCNSDMSTLARRLNALEGNTEQLRAAIIRIESAVGSHGSVQEDVRLLKAHVTEVTRVLDAVSASTVPDLQRRVDELQTAAVQADRSLATLQRDFQPNVDRAVGDLRGNLDALRNQFTSVKDVCAQLQSQWQQERAAVENRDRTRAMQERAVDEALREVVPRIERLEREQYAKIAASVVELTKRTDDNFRQVEASSRAVDSDLSKLRTDIANTRAELNSVDNDTAHRLTKLKDDVDGKFAMLLQLLQNFERNTMVMEQHVEAAGRALANPRSASAPGSTLGIASSPYSVGSGGDLPSANRYFSGSAGGVSSWVPAGGAAGVGSTGGLAGGEATTTTLSRDGYMSTQTQAAAVPRPLSYY